MEIKNNYLGTNLKHFRELDMMTKTQLANILGVSPTEIGQLERCEIPRPSFQVVESIADYFGVDMKELARTDLRGTGISIDRHLYSVTLASKNVNDCLVLESIDHTIVGFLKTLADAKYYSVRNGVFSNETSRFLQPVPKK